MIICLPILEYIFFVIASQLMANIVTMLVARQNSLYYMKIERSYKKIASIKLSIDEYQLFHRIKFYLDGWRPH